MSAFWIYKCNSKGREHQRAWGDWAEVFASTAAREWGTTKFVPELMRHVNNRPVLRRVTNLKNSSGCWHGQDVSESHLRAWSDTRRSIPPKKRSVNRTNLAFVKRLCVHSACRSSEGRRADIIDVAMSDATQILSQIETDDTIAAEQLLPLVYDELRKLAAHRLFLERPGHT